MNAIADILVPRDTDLGGGFVVRRVLPQAKARSIGPFVFLDHIGPHQFAPGAGMDVRPHPHIGLATVTWLFEGAMMHRDSLGTVQRIEPGAVNLMTAGSGIAHSERTPPDLRAGGSRIHGMQFWVALPAEREEIAPAFQHVAADALPAIRCGEATGTLVMGEAFGARSPVNELSPTLFTVWSLPAGGRMTLPLSQPKQAIYMVEGTLDCEDASGTVAAGQLAVMNPGGTFAAVARDAARFALIGGAPLGPRHMYWNFVHSSQQRIEQAKADWTAGRFAPVPGETEFIPLPG